MIVWSIYLFLFWCKIYSTVTFSILCSVDSKNGSPKVSFQNNYYIEVPEKSMKLDALAGILSVLEANFVIVLSGSSKSAYEVQSIMEFSHECRVIDNTCHGDVKSHGLTSKYPAIILIDQFEIPLVKAEKVLVVVFDAPKDPLHFSANQTHSNALLVNIITPSEKASISDSEEVNPMLYGFFRCRGNLFLLSSLNSVVHLYSDISYHLHHSLWLL